MRVLIFISIGLCALFSCQQAQKQEMLPPTEVRTDSTTLTTEPLDSILKKELIQIGVEDQTLRFLLPDVTKRFGNDSKEYAYIWSLIHRQDSICIQKTTALLDQHGWVGKSRIGDEANQAIWLVIQHAALADQEKYLPLLKKSVANSESEGWHLAFLEDRMLMYKKEKQRYGSQALWDKEIKKMKIYPIEDVANVDKRREQLGLIPIKEFAESNGYVFDQLP